MTRAAPNQGVAAAPSGPFSGTLGITDPYGATGTLAAPDYGPYETLVDITISGYTRSYQNTVVPGSPSVGTLLATYDARPIGGCVLGAGLRYPDMYGQVLIPVPPNCYPHAVQASYQWLTTVRGAGQVERFPAPIYRYNGIPIERYEGDLSVFMYRPSATLVVQPDRWVVQAGSGSVVFRARRTPDRYQNAIIPLTVLSWKWIPDVGSPTTLSCDTVCSYSPPTSGQMEVKAAVNGEVQTKMARIPVNPCPPMGNPWMDNPDFRAGLERDLAASNPGGPNEHEVPGMWYTNDVTGEPIFHSFPFFNPTPCRWTAPLIPTYSGETWEILTHTHPRYPGQPDCLAGRSVNPGPSDTDWRELAGFNSGEPDPIDGCIIQQGAPGQSPTIYCYPDPANPGGYTRYPKQPDACFARRP